MYTDRCAMARNSSHNLTSTYSRVSYYMYLCACMYVYSSNPGGAAQTWSWTHEMCRDGLWSARHERCSHARAAARDDSGGACRSDHAMPCDVTWCSVSWPKWPVFVGDHNSCTLALALRRANEELGYLRSRAPSRLRALPRQRQLRHHPSRRLPRHLPRHLP